MKIWDFCKIVNEEQSIICDGCGISDSPLVALLIPCFVEIYICKNCLKRLLLALELKSKDKLKSQQFSTVVYLNF